MTTDTYPKFLLPSGNWTTDEERADRLWAKARPLPLRDDPPDYCIPDDLPEFDDYWLSWAEPDDTLREQREEY